MPQATTETPKLISPWQLARDIADWLPRTDRARALRIIAAHERQHARAARQQAIQGAD